MSRSVRFHPASDKILLQLDNKMKTSTELYIQKGYIDNHLALRIFKKDKIIKTIPYPKKKKVPLNASWKIFADVDIWEIIRSFGGQSPDHAHNQREDLLTIIVRKFFEKAGYNCEEQPKIEESTPDMLVTKELPTEDPQKKMKYSCYVELKAYFGKTIVGEPEVAQLLKYYAIINSDEEITKQVQSGVLSPPKFMLFTSGDLTPEQDNALLNGELEKITDIEEKESYVKAQYKTHLKDLGYTRSLEARDTRSIYYNASSKIKRYYRENNWSSPKIIQLKSAVSLIDIIEGKSNSDYDVVLIPADIFAEILGNAGMQREQELFNRIRVTWMERLIFDDSILIYSDEYIPHECKSNDNLVKSNK